VKNIPDIVRLDTVDSTNTYIRNHQELWDRQYCTVVAREQTGGKGRFERTWLSEPGLDLACSMVFIPPGSASDFSCVTLLAGLAVHRALSPRCGKDLNLKWPNDIRWKTKKLGGILCEAVPAARPPVVIIGIGINVNRDRFPGEIASTAVSLKIATGTDHSVDEVFHEIMRHCVKILTGFRTPIDESLIREWEKVSQSIGSPVRFVLHDRVEDGVLSAINPDGSIRITTLSGNTIDGYRGEVLFADDE
jgi:BirA family transcriptional regulator, biotin operon repressor / biotin---[acetyl-CoA-carboxylase] ligase